MIDFQVKKKKAKAFLIFWELFKGESGLMDFPGFLAHRGDCMVISKGDPAVRYNTECELGEYHVREQQNVRCGMSLGS